MLVETAHEANIREGRVENGVCVEWLSQENKKWQLSILSYPPEGGKAELTSPPILSQKTIGAFIEPNSNSNFPQNSVHLRLTNSRE